MSVVAYLLDGRVFYKVRSSDVYCEHGTLVVGERVCDRCRIRHVLEEGASKGEVQRCLRRLRKKPRSTHVGISNAAKVELRRAAQVIQQVDAWGGLGKDGAPRSPEKWDVEWLELLAHDGPTDAELEVAS